MISSSHEKGGRCADFVHGSITAVISFWSSVRFAMLRGVVVMHVSSVRVAKLERSQVYQVEN